MLTYCSFRHRTDQTRRKHKSDDESDNIENQYENEILPASISKKRTRHLLPVKTALGFEKRTIEEDSKFSVTICHTFQCHVLHDNKVYILNIYF